jgi:hypothetical protein
MMADDSSSILWPLCRSEGAVSVKIFNSAAEFRVEILPGTGALVRANLYLLARECKTGTDSSTKPGDTDWQFCERAPARHAYAEETAGFRESPEG